MNYFPRASTQQHPPGQQNNTSVMSVNIGHFDINLDISFYNAANRICLTSSGKTINPKLTTCNMLMYNKHT